MDIYINTINKYKIEEIKYLFNSYPKYKLHFLNRDITEILSNNIKHVIKEKARSAYLNWHIPIIIEHGSLEIEYLNKFPGALSKPMWDLVNEKICGLIPKNVSRNAKVISGVCYCDGKIIKPFIGETNGTISLIKKGAGGFQFDPIFIPKGSKKTYAEMTLSEKMKYSQATISYGKLIKFLNKL